MRIIHNNGSVSTLAGGGSTGADAGSYLDSDDPLAARFSRPVGVCTDNEGSVLICDHLNHQIRTVMRNGSVRTLAGSTGGYADNADPFQAKFYCPHGIAFTIETFGGLVSGCRDPMPYIVRVCFLEDALASLMLSFLSGVSLSTAHCEWVALMMLVVSSLHLLYVVYVRPLRSTIESAMNYVFCGVQVLMAVLCLAIVSGADSSGGLLMSVLGVVAVVQNASFFGQAVILAACAFVSESRKKHTALSGACTSGDTSMMVPASNRGLLAAPEAKLLPLIAANAT